MPQVDAGFFAKVTVPLTVLDEIFTDDEDEDDDNENGDGRKPSCLVVRCLKKFARYYNASITLLYLTFRLSKKVNSGKKVDTISISVSIESVSLIRWRTLVDKNNLTEVYTEEHALEEYAQELGISGIVNSASKEHFNEKFCKSRKTPLYVHAEVQLAIYYCLNPHVIPIYGMIGVSKYCCYTCNAFLK
jgi:hypothetical protein